MSRCRVEPTLIQLTGETMSEKTASYEDELRVDVAARGFWVAGQMAFLDVRVFNPMARRYSAQNIQHSYEVQY